MIISKTPFRISFFGGGTDYPEWYREHGGAVIATSIDKYCYISCRTLPPFFEHKHRIVYSKSEYVKNISEIQHPSVRAVLMEVMDTGEGLEIHHDADIPARSGLGTSSSFTVGMLNTMSAHQGRFVSKKDLALNAIRIEQNVLREAVGSQDQITAAYGGFNKIDFKQDNSFEVTPLIMNQERRGLFEESFLLFFTGLTRFATEIAETQIKNFAKRSSELKAMFQLVGEAEKVIQNPGESFEDFGRLLDVSWKLKRSLSDAVSTSFIDEAYETGIKAGATGGKLLGAGGGGFILFFVKPEQQKNVLAALKNLLHVQFKFDTSGSKIALYDPSMF